jgi:DNA-binding NarL/FixJ family response regulator
MDKINTFLSYPGAIYREGLRCTLGRSEAIEVIGETSSHEEALAAITSRPPQVAVLGMRNGMFNDPQALRRIELTCRPWPWS